MPGIASPAELWLPQRGLIVPVPLPPTYLKGDWRFGIGEGTKLPDLSRYRAHGTIVNADWATGVHGKCLDFNSAVPDYVLVPAAYTQLNFISEDFSFVIRFRADSIANAPAILCRGSWEASGYYLRIESDGNLEYTHNQDGDRQRAISSDGDIAINTWYTVGMTRDGKSVKLYKNGVDITLTAEDFEDPLTSALNFIIGGYGTGPMINLDGKFEFLRIFGRALPASEHLAWHNVLA